MKSRSLRRAGISLVSATALLVAPAVAPHAMPAPTAQAQIIPPAPGFDHLGRPNEAILMQLEGYAERPGTPEKVSQGIEKLVAFFRGTGKPGVPIPRQDIAPRVSQFAIPTAAQHCIDGEGGSVGLAMMVPGPAPLPLPGVPSGNVNFVFTALGTGPVAAQQNTSMRVHWLNIMNFRSGVTELHHTNLNPEGPATINGTAETGPGLVFAYLEGGVTTDGENGPANCEFTPTAGVTQVF